MPCRPPARMPSSLCPSGRSPYVTVNKPQVLLLSLAVTLALAACKRDAAPAADSAATPAPAEAKALTLDESKLPPMNSFKIGDLDTSKNACARLRRLRQRQMARGQRDSGRSIVVGRVRDARRALGRRAAPARRTGSGRRQCDRRGEDRRRLLVDRHGRGQDQCARHCATEGLLERDRCAGRWPRGRRVLAQVVRQGRRPAVRLRPGSRLQGFQDEHGLRLTGGPGPAGPWLLLRCRQEGQARTPTRSTSPRCSSCPASPPPTPPSRRRTLSRSRPAWPKCRSRAKRCRATSSSTTTPSRRPMPTS